MLSRINKHVKTSADIFPMVGYFFTEDFEYDEKAVRKKLQKEGVFQTLEKITGIFQTLETFDAESTDKALHQFIEETGIGFGAVMAPLRIAVSNIQSGLDLFPMLAVLGRDRVLSRLQKTVGMFFWPAVFF